MAQQNTLDFLIAAHVSGQEQMAKLINTVGSLQKETERLKTANAGLAASSGAVIQNGVRYNNALDAQSKALRNARQGTQQLGMQMNDFFTSVSTGASPIQAFNQQLGQVGYAMSMMGGVAGKVGAFLAGPWGAAVLIGTMALGPFIEKLFQSKDAAEKAAQANYKYLDSVAAGNMADLIKAEGELTDLQEKRLRLQTEAMKKGRGRGLLFGGSFGFTNPRKELQEVESQIRWTQLAVNRGNQALEKLSKKQTAVATGGLGRAGGSGRAAAREGQKAAEQLAKSEMEWQERIASEKLAFWEDQEKLVTDISNMQAEMRNSGLLEMTKQLGEQMANEIDRPMQELQNSFDSIGKGISDSFKGMLTGAMSWKDGMRSLIGSVIDELWRLYVVQQIVGVISSGLKSLGLPLPAVTPKAVGGYVGAQQPYLVGEKGPELFVPGGSGTIIPNKNMAGGSGGSSVTVNVDARGSADPAAVRAQVEQGIRQAAPAIIAAAEARTVSGLRRPRLGGAMQ